MSAGKAAAQTAHAVAMLGDFNTKFVEEQRRTVVVLEADNENQLKNLNEYLFGMGLSSYFYIDEGVNEVGPYSVTALAVEPFDEENDELRQILEPFHLYTGEGNKYEEAYKHLSEVARGFQSFSGLDKFDHTPRWMRKTLEFLEKRK